MSDKKPHHNIGNTYAAKENPSTARVPFMCTRQQADNYSVAGGVNRSDWIKRVLDEEIKAMGITDDNHDEWIEKHRPD